MRRHSVGRSLLPLGVVLALTGCGPGGTLPDTTAPATPAGLVATPGDAQVHLSWDANGEADLAGYTLHRGTQSGNPTESTFVPAPTTTSTITGLTNGATYFFSLDARDTAGNTSARSAEVSATPTAGTGTPPIVVTTTPPNGATDVPLNGSLSVTFSSPMQRPATEAAWSAAPAIPCSFSWNFISTVMTCTPTSDLTQDTSHTVTLGTGATDTSGLAMASPFTFSFATGSSTLAACVFGNPTSTFGTCLFGP
jgi:hypothetical protein